MSMSIVVYNCFFAETGQATAHQRDIILHVFENMVKTYLGMRTYLSNLRYI